MAFAVHVQQLTKTFGKARPALSDVSLEIHAGEMVALIGASGSGKSTLLRHIAGLTAGDGSGGTIVVNGSRIQQDGRIAGDVRRQRRAIGVIFQQFNLVERLPLITNVLVGTLGRVPLWRSLFRRFTREEKRAAMEALHRVGMADRAAQRASTLSGGQQQRAAIARALVQQAKVILADEPIASLDPESSRRVMEILSRINREDGRTVIVTLHQVEFALRYCSRVVALKDGQIAYDGPSTAVTPGLLRDLYGADAEFDFEFDPEPRRHKVTVQPRPRLAGFGVAEATA
jgi:phosphonate transport system ATP-binding protein